MLRLILPKKMTEKLGELLTQYKVGEGPTQVGLKLPKLKEIMGLYK